MWVKERRGLVEIGVRRMTCYMVVEGKELDRLEKGRGIDAEEWKEGVLARIQKRRI